MDPVRLACDTMGADLPAGRRGLAGLPDGRQARFMCQEVRQALPFVLARDLGLREGMALVSSSCLLRTAHCPLASTFARCSHRHVRAEERSVLDHKHPYAEEGGVRSSSTPPCGPVRLRSHRVQRCAPGQCAHLYHLRPAVPLVDAPRLQGPLCAQHHRCGPPSG